MTPPRLGIGLVGSGFMGRQHTLALRAATGTFALPLQPAFELVADVDAAAASRAAGTLGFARSTGDWRQLVADPAVDLVDITTPNTLHAPIALAAIAAGKAVWCEKPLAVSASEAKTMADAAEAARVATQVGFTYLRNPIIALARDIVASGELGRIIDFRGIHAEDYMADPATPYSWRLDPLGGPGAVADLGSHIVAMARHLLGPIEEVIATAETIVSERAAGSGERRAITVPDQARALVRFANGAGGTLYAGWVTAGRQMQLAWELTGTKGSLAFSQERLNELALYAPGQRRERRGYTTITATPDHPPYGDFCPAPGHQLGFNDLKVIEVRDLIVGLAGTGPKPWPDFREGWEVQRVVDAIMLSAAERRWVAICEI